MENIIGEQADSFHPPISPAAIASSSSPEIFDFVKFIVDRAGKSAVSIINTCAMDDSPYWRFMFEAGMADAISEDPVLEDEFLGRMCSKPGLPHAWKLMDAYLHGMPLERKKRLFSAIGLRKRGHHFSICFYGSSFMTLCGAHLLQVLKVMISHGLPMQPLIDRNVAEIERAALLGHVEFLKTIVSSKAKLPDELFKSIMRRESEDGREIAILSMLLDECDVDIEHLMSQKMLSEASPKVRSYLHARHVRLQRVPETEMDPEEEDFFETEPA